MPWHAQFCHLMLSVSFMTNGLNESPNNIIVLYCIDGVIIAALMHCDLFQIYCAPRNLGITRT